MPLIETDRLEGWLSRNRNGSEWKRLQNALDLAQGFEFLAVHADDIAAEGLIGELLARHAGASGVALRGMNFSEPSGGKPIVTAILDELENAPRPYWFWFRGGGRAREEWLELSQFFLLLNQKRDVISNRADAPFILVLHPEDWVRFRRNAPDFWSIHQAVFRFGPGKESASEFDKFAFGLAGIAADRRSRTPSGWHLPANEGRVLPSEGLLGRRNERRHLSAQLQKGGARVMVFGAAGIGKTTLVRAVVSELLPRYPEGAWWVPFSDLPGIPRERAAAALAGLLGDLLPGTPLPADLEGRARLFRATTAARTALFVFDDVEEPETIAWLIPGEGASLVIISRSRLQSPDVFDMIDLRGLSHDEGERLLRGLAPSISPSDARSMVAALGAHPLALQIVGKLLAPNPEQTAETLKSLHLSGELSTEKPLVLSALAEFAVSRATPGARELWPVVGLFHGDFTIEEAAAVADLDTAATSERLRELADLGVVTSLPDGRFRFEEPLRAVAIARLSGLESSDEIQRRNVHHDASSRLTASPQAMESLASLLERYRTGPDADPLKRRDLLRVVDASLAARSPVQSLHAATSIANVAVRHGDHDLERIGIRWMAKAAERLGALLDLALLRRWVELAEHDAPGDTPEAYLAVAFALRQSGMHEGAARAAEEARSRAVLGNDVESETSALLELADIYREAGESRRAAGYLDEAIAKPALNVRPQLRLKVSCSAAEFAYQQGNLKESFTRWLTVLSDARGGGDATSEFRACFGLGRITEAMSRFAEAEDWYKQALVIATRIGDRSTAAACTLALGRVAQRVGNLRGALRQYYLAEEAYREIEGSDGAGRRAALWGTAQALRDSGSYSEALQAAQELLRLEESAHGPDHPETTAAHALTAMLLKAIQQECVAVEKDHGNRGSAPGLKSGSS